MKAKAVIFLAILAGACGYPAPSPQRPTIELPELREGDQLVLVEGEGTITSETSKSVCSDPKCWVTEKREVNAKHVSVQLRDATVTKGQIQVMLEPDWAAKERAYDRWNARCRGAGAWRKLALGTVVASALSYPLLHDRLDGNGWMYVGGGALALGAALWTIGRVSGGGACVDAHNMYTDYYFFRDQTEFAGRDADEVKALVRKFNTRHAVATP